MKYCIYLTIIALPCSAADFQRDLSADRPDATESPYTVEAGGIQVESSLWAFARDRENGITTETWSLAETNIKFGLSSHHDLQFVIRPWIREDERGSGSDEGFGDMDLRLKWNLWGNDSGVTAGALMPYVTIPSGTNASTGEWQGGIIFPVAIEINERLGAGVQLEIARAWDEEISHHEWQLSHTAVLGFAIAKDFGAFVEYLGVAAESGYQSSVFGGLTWSPTPHLQWDIAVGVGLNESAEDFSIAQGVTFRF